MKNSRAKYDKSNICGDLIKYFRIKSGISYQELSDKLMLIGIDIHKQSLYAIEIGKRTITDYELCAIAVTLNITSEDLLKGFENKLNEDFK